MLIDLTHKFVDAMPVFPGDASPRLYQTNTFIDSGYSNQCVESGMHAGTHIDAPGHMIEGDALIPDIPLSRLNANGHLLDARNQKRLMPELLEGHSIDKGDIVLVWTDWSKKFGNPEYFDAYPEIDETFARRLVALGVSIVGLDTPSPDRPPFPIHKILLGSNVLIIENLANLEALAIHKSFRVHAYPVKFQAGGAPVRVVAEAAE